MKKICHIKCNNKYWEQLNLYKEWTQHTNTYSHYLKIIKLWDEKLKINHLHFRKQIRDIIINDIIKNNAFDVILESNQHCKEYFKNNSSENIIFFQQDDDDIFLFLPELKELHPELNIFVYSCIDPIGGRRKKGYKIRPDLEKIQTNHCVIYNTNNDIITKHNLYEADHTKYDYLKQHYKYHTKPYPFTIQLYHLHSISLWKHQLKFSEKDYTKKDIFLNTVKEYINNLEEIYLNNKDILQLNPIINLYKKLI